MSNLSEAFVGLDTSKLRNSVAIAEGGRTGEVRFLGEIDNTPAAVRKLVKKLATKYDRLSFCYEAGPTGYGLYRQITSLGHACIVAAPSLIPRKPGDRVKTNRRDAISLVRQLRAGELTAVWVPDERHEAMRDLTRARQAAVEDLRRFRTPGELMAYLGLVPSEDSTGDRVKRGPITKAGNRRARRTLVECSWSYQHPPRVGKDKQAKVAAAPPAVREIAWKAQSR